MNDRQGDYGRIVEGFSVARRQMTALAIAIGAQDQLGALVVRTRLELALVGIASCLHRSTELDDDITLMSTIELLTDKAGALLALAPRRLHIADSERVVRWEHARWRPDAVGPTDPDLFAAGSSSPHSMRPCSTMPAWRCATWAEPPSSAPPGAAPRWSGARSSAPPSPTRT